MFRDESVPVQGARRSYAWQVSRVPPDPSRARAFRCGLLHTLCALVCSVAGWRPRATRALKNARPDICKLVKQCWHDNPQGRPTFEEILLTVAELKDEGLLRSSSPLPEEEGSKEKDNGDSNTLGAEWELVAVRRELAKCKRVIEQYEARYGGLDVVLDAAANT